MCSYSYNHPLSNSCPQLPLEIITNWACKTIELRERSKGQGWHCIASFIDKHGCTQGCDNAFITTSILTAAPECFSIKTSGQYKLQENTKVNDPLTLKWTKAGNDKMA